MSVDDLVAEGDRVAARVILTGTHTGEPFLGIAAERQRVRASSSSTSCSATTPAKASSTGPRSARTDLMRQLGAAAALSPS